MRKTLLVLFILFTTALTACMVEAPENNPIQTANYDMIEPVVSNEPNITTSKNDTLLSVENTVREEVQEINDNIDEASSIYTTPEPSPEPSSLPYTPAPLEEQLATKEEQSAQIENEPDLIGWVLYETDNIELLVRDILEGNVIYYNVNTGAHQNTLNLS